MGWHLSFDGNDDLVSVTSGALSSLDIDGDITLEAVINASSDGSGAGAIIRGGGGVNEQYSLQYDYTNDRIMFESYSGSFDQLLTLSSSAPKSEKLHIAGVRANNIISIYINGILESGPSALTAPTAIPDILYVGRDPSPTPFKGTIDEVRVYSRAMDVNEVSQHARGIFEDNSNLELLWKLDTGSGTTATDDSGNGNDGTISGASWVSGNLFVNKVMMTVYEHAGEVALGDPIQYTAAVIDGVASAAIVGEGNKRRRVRLFSNVDAWVKWGENPTATGGSDSMPLSFNNPQYVDIESGHTLHAISR